MSSHGPTGMLEVPDEVHRRRWWTLAVLCLSLVIIVMDNTILNVALPTLVRDIHASTSQLQWIVDAYTLVFAGLLLTAGALGDRYGRKGALSAGLAVFGLGSIAATFAHSAGALIGARAIMGAAGAFIMPSTLSLLTNVFRDAKERTKAIGIWAAASGIGVILGPVTGGWLLEHFSWESVFWLNIPIVLIAIVAGHLVVPTSKDPSSPRTDAIGALLSIVGLVTLVYSIIEAPARGWTAPGTLLGFGVAVAIAAVFVAWERRCTHPMLDMAFFRNRRFSVANGAVTLTFFAMFGSLFMISQYLQFVKGYTPLQSGLRMVPWAFVMMTVAPLSSVLVHKVGTRVVVAAGLGTTALGLVLLSTIQVDTPFLLFFARMAVLAAGMGLVMAPATDSVMGSLPPEKAGVGSAVNDTTRELGGALGVAVIGSLVASIYRRDLTSSIGDTLPAEALSSAKSSLGGALAVAGQMGGDAARSVVSAANDAFMNGLSAGLVFGAISVAIAAVLVGILLPARAHDHDPAEPGAAEAADLDPALVG